MRFTLTLVKPSNNTVNDTCFVIVCCCCSLIFRCSSHWHIQIIDSAMKLTLSLHLSSFNSKVSNAQLKAHNSNQMRDKTRFVAFRIWFGIIMCICFVLVDFPCVAWVGYISEGLSTPAPRQKRIRRPESESQDLHVLSGSSTAAPRREKTHRSVTSDSSKVLPL